MCKLMQRSVIILVLNCIVQAVSLDDDPLVKQLDDGQIRGIQHQTVGLNQTYYAFKGIPFGKPPVGPLRFLAPLPNDPWDGILDCTEDKVQCVQGDPVTGVEDCLYINVYTTTLKNDSFLPVIVGIYGGEFLEGNGSYVYQAPDYLLDEGVIFVSFNYRLGIFGFYSTGDKVAPGNAGLKDQVLALKWVHHNIMQFGGDPENVTLFGQSAGAASISYLLQSNIPDGLFKGAIMDSGTSLCRWSRSRQAKSIALKLGASFGYLTVTNTKGLLQNLQSQNYVKIQTYASSIATALILAGNTLDGLLMAPVIEPISDEALFTGISYELLANGAFKQVPILMGFNSNEAAVFQISIILQVFLTKYTLTTDMMVPTDMNVPYLQEVFIGSLISLRYFDSFVAPLANDTSILGWLTDELFARPIIETATLMSEYQPVYFYIFDYEGVLGGHANRTVPGAVHTEELSYIYRKLNNITATADDEKMRATMCRLWTNFAKYGDPTPSIDPVTQNILWTPARNYVMNYMYIDRNLTVTQNPEASNITFWTQYYDAFGYPPYYTY